MARVLVFCPKQTLVGTPQSGGQDYYSEIFDVTDVSLLTAEMQVFGTTNTAGVVSGFLEETADPAFDAASWTQNGSALVVTGVGLSKQSYSGLQRFVRAKVTLPSGVSARLCVDGVGRNDM